MLIVLKLRILRLRDDYWSYLLFTVMAVGLTLIFGNVFSDGNSKINVYIINNDKGEYSSKLIDDLENSKTFNFIQKDYENAIKDIESSKVVAGIMINETFTDNINNNQKIKIDIIKYKDSIQAFNMQMQVKQTIDNMINNIKISENMAVQISKDKSNIEKLKDQINQKIDIHTKYKKIFSITKRNINKGKMEGYNSTIHYLIGYAIFFSAFSMVFSIGDIVEEKKNKTWHRQLVSSLSKGQILGGNFIFTFLLSFMQILFILIIGKYILKLNVFNNTGAILLIIAAYVFVVTSAGLFIASFIKTQEQLSSIAPLIIVATSMLGGCMWPLEIISSKTMILIASLTPQKWAIQALENVGMRSAAFVDIIPSVLVLLLMGSLYLLLGIKSINRDG